MVAAPRQQHNALNAQASKWATASAADTDATVTQASSASALMKGNTSTVNAQAKRWAINSREDDADHQQHDATNSRDAAGSASPPSPSPSMRLPPPRHADTTFAERELAARRRGDKGCCDVWEPLARAVELRGDEPAMLIDLGTGAAVSYAQLASRAQRLGHWLRDPQGGALWPGGCVGILTPNCTAAIEAHFAIVGYAGAVALNCNPRLSPDETAYVLEGANAEILLADKSYGDLLAAAVVLAPLALRALVWTDIRSSNATPSLSHTGISQQQDYEALVRPPSPSSGGGRQLASSRSLKLIRHDDDGAEMYYTSGTSGRPKGVVLSRRNVILHALGCMVEHRLHKDDVWLHAAPMFHLVDAYAIFAITWVGGKHVTLPSFSAAAVVEAISTYRITVSNVASTMITLLLADPTTSAADLSSLELLSCGGAPLAKSTVRHALKRFECEFFLSYGMTECCGKISMSLVDPSLRAKLDQANLLDLICTSGRAFGLMEVRVVTSKKAGLNSGAVPIDEDDAVDVDEAAAAIGEVWIRGPTLFPGYNNNPKATAEAITPSGWFRTGDLATVNEHKYLTITDRAKDMILVGSENVYCVEVERVLHDHPAVKHACVYGLPDDALGERVKACIVLKPGAPPLTTGAIRKHAAAHLADFKVPTLVDFVDKLPMTGSGKMAKAQLKKRDLERIEARRAQKKQQRAKPQINAAPVPAMADDVYGIEWYLSPLPSEDASRDEGWWMVVCATKADELGRLVVHQLKKRSSVSLVRLEIDATLEVSRASLEAAMDEIDERVLAGVVMCCDSEWCSLGAGAVAVAESTHAVLRHVLALLQAVASTRPFHRVVVATRGAAAVRGRVASSPAGGAVVGACRSARAENPWLKLKHVDLCPDETVLAMDADVLCREARSAGEESAWRRRARYAPALRRLDVAKELGDFKIDAELAAGSHVVTGGTGGLGLEWASRLARAGGASTRLVLASRRAPSSDVAVRLEQLAAKTGASIIVERADVSDPAQAATLVQRAASAARSSTLSVWHLAGVVDDGVAQALTWERFEKVLAPKVVGSLGLYDAALAHRAKRLVLFSSIYGLLGSRELTHYAAANAFQDALAKLADSSREMRVQAVSWGTWADAGMAHRFGPGFEARIKATGMRFVPLDGGFDALASVARSAEAHAAVLPADWALYAKRRRAQGLAPHALAAKLAHAAGNECPEAEVPQVAANVATPLLAEMQRSTQPDRVLERFVLDLVAQFVDVAKPDPDAPVAGLGMTSVNIVDLATRLADALDHEVSPTLVFECVSIRGICTRLANDLCRKTLDSVELPVNTKNTITSKTSPTKAPTCDALCQTLSSRAAELLGDGSRIDLDTPVASLGLSSMHVVELATFLAEQLEDDDISPTVFFEHVTLRGVCTALAQDAPFTVETPRLLAESVPSPEESTMIWVSSMACRLPGNVVLPEELWRDVLLEGKDCVWDEPPADRPHNGRPSAYLRAAVLTGFDRVAFGISAAEAAAMDPQQRLLLECCAETLERSGRRSTPAAPGSVDDALAVGVFAAIETSDYAFLYQRAAHDGGAEVDAYCGTGWHGCVGPNRVSYVMDLRGPSAAVNTACSSSLTCVSVARHSLLAGECEAALVCGANLQLQPYWSKAFVAAGMLSPTNRCRFADDAADGYVRGEGVGVALLETTAPRHPACVVAGVGVGQDGRSNGLTAPNPTAQVAVIRAAFDGDKKRAESVVMIEAHGTGTRLGDPIELGALGECKLGPADAYLRCASIKTNLGHLEGSSGLAGLLKAALCLSYADSDNRAPRSLHFHTPNAHVPWDKLRVAVVASDNESLVPTRRDDAVIGVSSFGFGGALGHVALRSVRADEWTKTKSISGPCRRSSRRKDSTSELTVVPLGAHSDAALRATAKRWARWVSASSLDVGAIASAATERLGRADPKARPYRAAVAVSPAGGVAELGSRLDELSRAAESSYDEAAKRLRSQTRPRIALAFTGQGSAYVGMGRHLYRALPSFKAAYDDCAAKLERHVDRASLDAAVLGCSDDDDALLEDASIGQPALFAMQYALARSVLATLHLELPAAVVGHSLGEIAAAAVAGILSLASAAELVCARGAAMASLRAGVGGMVAIRASAYVVQAALEGAHCFETGEVQIAADNSSVGCTVSGTDAALEAALKLLEKHKTKRLDVLTGFHSICVEPCLPAIRRAALKLSASKRERCCPLYSTLLGDKLEDDASLDADYWCAQARGAVRFASAVRTLLSQHRDGALLIVEIGASPHLLPHLADLCVSSAQQCAACCTLRGPKQRGHELAAFSAAVSTLVASGALPLDPTLCSPQIALPPTAYVSPAPSWFSESKTLARNITKPPAQPSMPQHRPLVDPERVTFSAAWAAPSEGQPPTKRAASCKWSHVLLLRDGDESARDLAAWLRSLGSIVTELPTSAASSAVVQSWDAVVFAAGLGGAEMTSSKRSAPPQIWRPRDERTPLLANRRRLPLATPNSTRAAVTDRKAVTDLQAALRTVLTASASKAPRRFVVVARSPDACPSRSASAGALIGLARSARREGDLMATKVAVKIVEVQQQPSSSLKRLPDQLLSLLDEHEDVKVVTERHLGSMLRVRRIIAVNSGEAPKNVEAAERIIKNGIVAVTGGTGALGMITAEYLVRRGASRVLLLSRSGRSKPTDSALWEALQAIARRRGAAVEVGRLDMCDAEAIDKFAAMRGSQLTGLVHAAGVANDGALSSRTSETLADAMRPKVDGALRLTSALDDVRRGRPLSFELYFSSTTALLGNAGQTDYGAANAALDALAASRRCSANRARAKAIASVQWGPWSGYGMAAQAKNAAAASEQAPYVPLEPRHADRRLDTALRLAAAPFSLEQDHPLSVVAFDWRALSRAAANSNHIEALVSTILGPAAAKRPSKLSAPGKCNTEAEVVRVMRAHLSRDNNLALSAATPIASLALDSLEVMAVVRDINAATGAELSVVDVLSAPTLGDIIAACPRQCYKEPDYEVEEEEQEQRKSVDELRADVLGIVSKHARDETSLTASTMLSTLALDSLEMMAIIREINGVTGAELGVVDVLEASSIDDIVVLASARKQNCSEACDRTAAVTSAAAPAKSTVPPMPPAGANALTDSGLALADVTKCAPQMPQALATLAAGEQQPVADLVEKGIGSLSSLSSTASSAVATDELREPSLAYRLYFTALSFLLGTQILLWGFVPLAWIELLAPLRFKLRPKLEVVQALQGFRSCEWVELMLPRSAGTYPGIPDSWHGLDGVLEPDSVFMPSWLWSARFCGELCATLVWYFFAWSIGCHMALIVAKWLVVGRYRAGVFPIWESSVGWRSALLQNAIACSFFKVWGGAEIWLPSPAVAIFLRLLGAKVGKRVSFSMCPVPDYVGFDLISIGDDAVFNASCRVHPVCLTTPCVITHGHVRVGNRAKVGVVAEVRHGAHVSDDAFVCAGAGTMGYVPPGAYALSGHVVAARRAVPPAGAVDTKIRVATERYGEQYVLYSLLPLLSFLVLMPVCIWTGVFGVGAITRLLATQQSIGIPAIGLMLFHVALLLFSVCVIPWAVLLVARAMRLAAYGPRGALGLGREVALTRGFVLAHQLVDSWSQLADSMSSTFFLYSGGMNWIWRTIGMRIGSDVILSEQIANHGLMDLVDVGSGSYLAARTAVLAADVDAQRGIVKLKRTTIGRNCFIGPLSVIMPGAIVEDGGATGSCAVVGEHTRASSGRICIGDGDKTLTLAWRPKPLDAFAGRERLWNIYSTLVFFLQNLIIKLVTIAPSWCLLLAGLSIARRRDWAPRETALRVKEVSHVLSPTMHAWLVVANSFQWSIFVLLLFTVALHVVIPARSLVHVAVKWLLVGTARDDGVAHPLRGRKHVAWCVTIQFGRMPAVPKSLRFLWEYVNAYAVVLGAKIGSNVRIYPEPEITQAFPEADVVEIGDDVRLSAHMYGHDFSNMNLRFKSTTAARGVNAPDAWQTQVLPGSHLPSGTAFHNVGRSVVFAGLCTEPNRVWSGNPVRTLDKTAPPSPGLAGKRSDGGVVTL